MGAITNNTANTDFSTSGINDSKSQLNSTDLEEESSSTVGKKRKNILSKISKNFSKGVNKLKSLLFKPKNPKPIAFDVKNITVPSRSEVKYNDVISNLIKISNNEETSSTSSIKDNLKGLYIKLQSVINDMKQTSEYLMKGGIDHRENKIAMIVNNAHANLYEASKNIKLIGQGNENLSEDKWNDINRMVREGMTISEDILSWESGEITTDELINSPLFKRDIDALISDTDSIVTEDYDSDSLDDDSTEVSDITRNTDLAPAYPGANKVKHGILDFQGEDQANKIKTNIIFNQDTQELNVIKP